MFYAVGLAVAGAAMLGVLPALKATGSRVQAQLRNLGSGGSTLRFGRVWSAAMIGQVALTVIVLPPAMGIATEGIRDRVLRARFPAEEYLAVRIELDRDAGPRGRVRHCVRREARACLRGAGEPARAGAGHRGHYLRRACPGWKSRCGKPKRRSPRSDAGANDTRCGRSRRPRVLRGIRSGGCYRPRFSHRGPHGTRER